MSTDLTRTLDESWSSELAPHQVTDTENQALLLYGQERAPAQCHPYLSPEPVPVFHSGPLVCVCLFGFFHLFQGVGDTFDEHTAFILSVWNTGVVTEHPVQSGITGPTLLGSDVSPSLFLHSHITVKLT
jgi:hypothetical protein